MSRRRGPEEYDGPEPPLFAMVRRTDPVTSELAAEDALVNASTHRRRVLEEHRSCPGGLTDFELAARLGLQQTSAGKRRGELRDAGLVYDSGIKRPAPSGSMAIVWKAV